MSGWAVGALVPPGIHGKGSSHRAAPLRAALRSCAGGPSVRERGNSGNRPYQLSGGYVVPRGNRSACWRVLVMAYSVWSVGIQFQGVMLTG